MITLYLLRHGETDFNRQGIVQGGGVDSDLNEVGRAQAEAFFAHYRHIPFDAVYCSKLKRTAQTLAPWGELGYAPTPVAALNELSWGIIEGQQPTPEVKEYFRTSIQRWQEGDLSYKIPGGQSPDEVWEAAKPFFEALPRQHPAGSRLMICTHGRTMRILIANLLGYGAHRMEMFHHRNTTVNVLRMNIHGRCFAERLDDLSHLS